MESSAGSEAGTRRPRDEQPRDDALVVAHGGCEILVARYAGYCYGVERALRLTEEALAKAEPPVATLGPIIHNPGVVAALEARGAAVVDDVDELDQGTLIIRTHGVAPAVAAKAGERALDVVDATCPFVAVAQRKAQALREAGYRVVILGRARAPRGGRPAGLRRRAGHRGAGPDDLPAGRAARQAHRRGGADDAVTRCARAAGGGARPAGARAARVEHDLRRDREAPERRLQPGRAGRRGRRRRREQQRQHDASGAAVRRRRAEDVPRRARRRAAPRVVRRGAPRRRDGRRIDAGRRDRRRRSRVCAGSAAAREPRAASRRASPSPAWPARRRAPASARGTASRGSTGRLRATCSTWRWRPPTVRCG